MTGEWLSLGTSSWNGGISSGRVLEKEKKNKKQQSQRDFTDKYIIKASFHFSSSLMLWINMISWYTPRDILGSGNEKCYSEKCLVCSHFG